MKDLEKQIKDAAYNFLVKVNQSPYYSKEAFIAGAKSEAAKEYWQQGMYSEEEVKKFLYNLWEADDDDFEKWFNENKK